jgi:outer membrane immunogenic protein
MRSVGIIGTLIFGSCLFAGAASAADMAVKAAPVIAPVFNWTGFYAGVNAGYGAGNASSDNNPVDPASQLNFNSPGRFGPNDYSSAFRQSGWIAGGQAGYNWQFSNKWVAGLEADLQYADVRGSDFHQAFLLPAIFGTGFVFDVQTQRRLEWFGTVRGRLGFLATPDLLLYGTGGLAYGQTRSSGDIILAAPLSLTSVNTGGFSFNCATTVASPRTTCYSGASTDTSVGWAAGAGGEFRIAGNWTAKLEYLHVDLPGASVTLVSPPPSGPGVSTIYRFNHQSYDFVRLGLNYKWGGGAVVAKY